MGARDQANRDAAHWRGVRRYLDGHRHELAIAAADLYSGLDRVAGTPLLAGAGWIPRVPVRFADIRLCWDPSARPAQVKGTEPASQPVRPCRADGRRFRSYADALSELAAPGLLENRVCYRLTGLSLRHGTAELTFGPGRYFDGINVGEAAAHEFAALGANGGDGRQADRTAGPHLDHLPLRALIGDPTDLARRPVNPAISMLTLRRDGDRGTTFLLHHRDATRVAHGGGLHQVVPVGVFQPSADSPAAIRNDFDLWRCAVREYSEELLGRPETYGDPAAAFDYESWPLYRSLTSVRAQGPVRSYLLGVGIDPLSLATDILAATVIEADVFDSVFAGIVARNAEGVVLGGGTDSLGFTGDNVERFTTREPMQAAGAAALALAWQHRELIKVSV